MTLEQRNEFSLRCIVNTPTGKGTGAELPLVLVMHGRGADAADLADIAPALDGGSGYRFVFPNAAKPFEPYPGSRYGFSWFDGWPPSRQSIHASRELLLTFLLEVLEAYPTPPGRIVISGFSQGALMAIDLGFRMPQPVAGVVAMSGAVWEEDMPDFRSRASTPVLIVHGTGDDVIPVLAARRSRRLLEEHGIDPEYHEFPMGHHLTPESLAVIAAFIQKVLA